MEGAEGQEYFTITKRFARTQDETGIDIRIFYLDVVNTQDSSTAISDIPTILLIHGFPQTSHQYRHVLKPLALAGYRLIVPDYRGAGLSPPPSGVTDYRKSTLASDLRRLIRETLAITSPIYVVGHDLGGMIAHAYASRYPNEVKAVIWGECPLPGTSIYQRDIVSPAQFHFLFHRHLDLAEHLVQGKERAYVQHFVNKLTFNAEAFTDDDIDHYARMYSLPGRMRAGMALYEAFETDRVENESQVHRQGKCSVPALALNGANSPHEADGRVMMPETYHDWVSASVDQAGHYIAEENPKGFVKEILNFLASHRD